MTQSNPNRIEAAGGRYRPDIDGLRALAVVPVVLYHFGVPPFSGGFVGVDIFFVISGFLITSLIHTEMQDGRFSILGFYERRVRRILPALYAVMAFCTVVGAVVLFPADFVAFAKSLLAAAGFVSNFQFWSEAGYFDLGASQKPLLHTWSLAVEEQFYFVFPALLWLLRKTRERTLLAALSALLVLSFAASLWAVTKAPVSAFYLLPFRFWELLLGGVLAVGKIPVPANTAMRNAVAAAGLGLIFWSIFALSAASSFPGFNALPPCLGAALLIYAGSAGKTVINQSLSTRLPVFVGLISYSLYLWHWPLYVFAKYAAPMGMLHPAARAVLIALSGLLGWLSWRYIEQPFRGRSGLLSRRALFVQTSIAVALFAAAGAVIWIGKGLPQRYPSDIRQILAAGQPPDRSARHCFSRSPAAVTTGNLCRIGDPAAAPTFILWGDSHSQAVLPAVAAAARQQHRAGLFAGHGYCAPLAGVTRDDVRRCLPFNTAALKLALKPGISEVVLVARWAFDAGAPPLGADDRAAIVLFDRQSKTHDAAGTPAAFARGLERTVRMLTRAHRKVVIVASVPENRVVIPEELAKMRILNAQWPVETRRSDFLARQAFVFSLFEKLAKRYGVTVIYPHETLCGASSCAVAFDGRPLYRDEHHLSAFGAMRLMPLMARGL